MRAPASHTLPYLALLSGLSLLALAPLLGPGYFYSAHDGRHSVFYVTMFDEAIRSGALWPRWAMHHNQGYGYPTFLVQAPFAFYVAELFVLLGAGITQAVKLAWAVGLLAGGWGMFALVRAWLLPAGAHPSARAEATPAAHLPAIASLCAVVAGLLYTYAPYRLLNVYVRAAFAETMLLAWLPWVFLAFERLMRDGAAAGWQGRLLAAAAAYAALLLTHSFAFVAVTPLLAAFVLFRLGLLWRQTRAAPPLLRATLLAASAGVAALLLAAIFLIPLFAEGPFLNQEEWTRDTYNYTRHWVFWGQFLSPFWGYGYSDDPAGANDGMGFQVGAPLVVLGFVAALLVAAHFLGRARRAAPAVADAAAAHAQQVHLLMLFLLLAALATLALMTPGAAALWGSIPLLAVIQFPWRLLGLAVFSGAALGGLTLWQLLREMPAPQRAHQGEAGLLALALLVVYAGLDYSQAAGLQPVEPWREDGRAVMEFERAHPDMIATTRVVEERFTQSPLTEQYLAADFSLDALARFGIGGGEGEVVRQQSLGHAYDGQVVMQTPGTLQIRLYEFPGWQVRVDGVRVPHRVSRPYGLLEIDLPAGAHRIEVWMGSTPARTAGAAISAATLLLLVGLWLHSKWPRRARRAAGRAGAANA